MRETPFWRRYERLLGRDAGTDVDDELETHLALRVENLMRQGHSESEAQAQAEREFGDVARIRREMNAIGRKRRRRERRAAWRDSLGQDLRLAGRMLRTSPGFASVVVFTLALGIGGTTAVFSVFESVLLAPLPYEEPGQLVRFYQYSEGALDPFRDLLTGPHFNQVRDQVSSVEGVTALYDFRETGLDLAEGGRAERLRVLAVSGGYFRVLRAWPLRGRGFGRDDEGPGRSRLVGTGHVVLSHELWQNRFGGGSDILGSTILLSAEPYTVVGIAPASFEDPIVGEVDAWLPLNLARRGANNEGNHFLTAIGRLRNGIGIEQARAELGSLNRALAERWPDVAEDTLLIVPLKEDLVSASSGTLRVLLMAVGLVLLVVCVNVANLFLVRATGRNREFAIRSALGSQGIRIARQLLVESLLLAALGGLLGLVLAEVGVDALLALGQDAIPRLAEAGLDATVLGFAALVTVGTGLAFGVAPALRFARIRPAAALREQSRSATGSPRERRLRSGLAGAQVALALALLAGAGALIASFHRLQQVDLGFRTERVLTFEVNLPIARYDAAQRAAFQEELARRLEAVPGVSAAGGTSRLPATGLYHTWGTEVLSGSRAGTEQSWISAQQRIVSGHFFRALEIPLLAGRLFDARDDAAAPPRSVVSAAFAGQAFPGVPLDEVVGERIAPLGEEREIIGVVGEVTLDTRGTPGWTVYQAHRQYAADRNWTLSQVVSTELDRKSVV